MVASATGRRVEVLRALTRRPGHTGVPRERLLAPLTGPGPALVLVSAPAGCGKTTLLAQLAVTTPGGCWLTLTPELGSVEVLLAHLQSVLRASGAGDEPWTSPTQLINALETMSTVLILDDLHHLAGTPALQVIRDLLEFQPAGVRLAISTRRPVEVGLARYRLHHTVYEIDADQLALRPDELPAAAAPSDTAGGPGSPAALPDHAGLLTWPAAVAMTGHGPAAIRQFVTEQLLAGLDAASVEFLVRSGAGESLSASESMRDTLRRAGLLTVANELPQVLDAPLRLLHRSIPPVPGAVDIRVLGGVGLTVDGVPVDTSALRPLHRELLAVFCLFADRVVHRDHLVDWFWPDKAAGPAQHNLQVAVSEIRRHLLQHIGRDLLVREAVGYRLQLTLTDGSDVRRFEQLLHLAGQAERRGDRDRAVGHLDEALTVFRGDVAPEIGYPEWVLAERDRLRQLLLGGCERLAALRAAAGRHREAVAAARTGLRYDRHRDGLWRQLISSLRLLDEPVCAAAEEGRYHLLLLALESDQAPAASWRHLKSVG